MHPLKATNQRLPQILSGNLASGAYFGLATLVFTAGLYFRVWPLSLTIRSWGPAGALAVMFLVALLVVCPAVLVWSKVHPEADRRLILRRTCLSLLIAAMVGVFASMGPRTSSIYRDGVVIRCGLCALTFCALQIAWLRRLEVWFQARLAAWRSTCEPVSVIDFFLAALIAVSLAEAVSYPESIALKTTPVALALNASLLGALACFLWAVFNRSLFALCLACGGYFLLSLLNAIKLRNLYAGLQLGDEAYLGELAQYTSFLTPGRLLLAVFLASVSSALFLTSWWFSRRRLDLASRGKMAVIAALILIGVATIPWIPGSKAGLRHVGILELPWDSLHSTRRNGLLFELALQSRESHLPVPENYSDDSIRQIAQGSPVSGFPKAEFKAERNGPSLPSSAANASSSINVIILLVESLMDPADLGRSLQREVLPNWNQMRAQGLHGFAISPRFASGSAESEFEVITGFSTSFLPPNSCAYKHFVKRPTPSLVRLFKGLNYHTTAIHVVPPGTYNYLQAYQHFGFDRFFSEYDLVNPPRDPFNGMIADQNVIDQILRSINQTPVYVQVFNQATHSPYLPRMLSGEPRFLSGPATPGTDEIEVYLQFIHRFDQQLGRLKAALERREERFILLMVGDHHPPLTAESGAYETPAFQPGDAQQELFRRRIPFLIWKNYSAPSQSEATAGKPADSLATPTVSMNLLSLLLLQAAGLEPQGQLVWNRRLLEECPVVSRDLFLAGGRAVTWSELPPATQQLVREYELLQYDQLIGKHYAELHWQPATALEPAAFSAGQRAARIPANDPPRR